MCGRFSLHRAIAILREYFGIDELQLQLEPHYNIAPSQQIPAVTNEGRRAIQLLKWGLVPSWAKDPAIGNRMINARAETAAEKPSFRSAMKKRRCLIPADGFFEWKKTATGKVPMYIKMKNGEPMAFAGLWEVWTDPGGRKVGSCTILTTSSQAHDVMEAIHDRMPVIVSKEDFDRWLDPGITDAAKLKDILETRPVGRLEAHAVSKRVNTPANDDSACVDPAVKRNNPGAPEKQGQGWPAKP